MHCYFILSTPSEIVCEKAFSKKHRQVENILHEVGDDDDRGTPTRAQRDKACVDTEVVEELPRGIIRELDNKREKRESF